MFLERLYTMKVGTNGTAAKNGSKFFSNHVQNTRPSAQVRMGLEAQASQLEGYYQ